jgi:predicted transcriptional regulator
MLTTSKSTHKGMTMNLQESHILALRGLIEQSPPLLEQLKQSKSMGDSAKVLAEAARQKGLYIDEEALSAYFVQATKQAQSAALSDAQLDAVSGGLTTTEWVVLSIYTFGIGCIIAASPPM